MVESLGVVSVHIDGQPRLYELTKRASDIAMSAMALVVISPFFLLIALLVRASSRGPIIYRQQRLAQGGRPFQMLKFRTMSLGAEGITGAVFAVENDPRVTRVGRVLRRCRLDELPQLLNVLRGEMSLVGPRPERPEFVRDLEVAHPRFAERLAVPAGLTGLAQVSVGYSSSKRQYRHKLQCDRLYIQRRSVGLDLWILCRTVAVVCTGKGAC